LSRNHPKEKCRFCKKGIEFHDPTVRREKKWYHAECYKLTIEEKPLEKDTTKEVHTEPTKPLTKIVAETKPKQKIIEQNPSLSSQPTPKPLLQVKPKPKQTRAKSRQQLLEDYEKDYLDRLEQYAQDREPQAVEAHAKPELETKRISDLDEQGDRPKVKHDPVLFLIACTIFIFLISAPFYLVSGFSAGAMLLGGILVIYQLFDARRWSKSKFRHGKHLPGIFPLLLLILPFAFGGLLAYEGFTLWESAYRSIILWGFTITFWSVMLMVPLALYSKNKEEQVPSAPGNPLISIIIPAYNEEKVIAKTIESLLEVDYPNKEIIVVDDGSKDNTLQIAKRYEQDKVKVLHKENGGKATALNYGLTFAKGEFVAILDADTIAGKNSLKAISDIFQDDENVAAVAGNIKVRNRVNWITWCQALEYVAGLQIARRAFDLFGAITIVPGALGSFRKTVIYEAGTYDKETIVEDFDATIKVLKSGKIVRGTTKSTAYTEAPETFTDFYKQRKRWYRGNLQVLAKHRDALTNPRFGFLQRLAFPYMILSMIVLPITGFLILGSAILAVIEGDIIFVVGSFAFFIALQYLLTALAVRIDGDDPKLILFALFSIFGFKQILDFLLLRQLLEQLFGRKASWTTAKRVGFDEK